jgi:DNA primase
MDQKTRDYLAGRGLADPLAAPPTGPSSTIVKEFRLGVVNEPEPGHEWLLGRLAIPYLGPRGNVYNLRFRCLAHEDCKAEGCDAKYISLPGYPSRVYNVRAIKGGHTTLHVTEGELDAVTLTACGLAAVGLPGVDSLPAHFPRLVAGFSHVFLWVDGDEAGRGLVREFTKKVPWAEAIYMKAGEDVNSVFVNGGEAAIRECFERVRDDTN